MEIYSARLLFEIDIEGAGDKQFDEELFLINASSEKEAYSMACKKGKTDQESFINTRGRLVSWKFVGVTELLPLKFQEGLAHITDKTLQPGAPEKFLESMYEKVNYLKQSYLYQSVS